jgi:hypothetical protein
MVTLFKQAQGFAHDFTGGAIESAFDLPSHQLFELRREGYIHGMRSCT